MDEPTEIPTGVYDKPRPAVPAEAPLRVVTAGELQDIVDAHKEWVASDGNRGQKADLSKVDLHGQSLRKRNLSMAVLSGADLRGADLSSTNLRRADLSGANLRRVDFSNADLTKAILAKARIGGTNFTGTTLLGAILRDAELKGGRPLFRQADMREADLRHADLTEADFDGANLREAKLREALLQDADLRTAIGLRAEQLAGANVSGAKLPDDIANFGGLAHVEELAKKARKIFVSMMLLCAYAWLTLATTTDARLLTDSASSPLPIIQTQIPIVQFYWAAPILVLGLYVYFHLYLERLWKGLAELPAVFPDGQPLDGKADPWLLIGLVRRYFPRLSADPPPLSRLENAVSAFLAWWVVPLTLLLLWGRYLSRHEWVVTGLHLLLLAAAIGSAVAFWWLMAATLRGEIGGTLPRFRWWRRAWTGSDVALAAGAVLLLAGLSGGSIQGAWTDPFGLSFAEIQGSELSAKPAAWTGQPQMAAVEIALVKGAQLRGRNLRNADAQGVFLVKADLRGADLAGADLSAGDLRLADLSAADLGAARLAGANLADANLAGANLRGAVFRSLSGRDTDLSRARLDEADLAAADLAGVNLEGAMLRKANLRDATLSGANLKGALFDFATLAGADLKGAELAGASLTLADLAGARLERAELSTARGLKQDQLDRACGDDETRLPAGLTVKACPPARAGG